jgi:hypothetical protein
MDNSEKPATLAHKTQDKDKQNNKHNTENQNDEQHGPRHKPGVIRIIKQLYVVVFLYFFLANINRLLEPISTDYLLRN